MSGIIYIRKKLLLLLIGILSFSVQAQTLSGFKPSGSFDEQQMVIAGSPPGTRILINAPLKGFGKDDKVLLIFYALPNGNTIEQTFGKKLKEEDDWHFNIQNIGAQTRFLRNILTDRTIVTIYLENDRKSWPSWAANTPGAIGKIKKIIEDMRDIFAPWDPQIVLNGHSGGGRFVFSYIEAVDKIPEYVVRIAFLDSSYGYDDTIHGPKITGWMKQGKNKYLCVLAYNDSVVIYNNKPLVSQTGGTWYRSKMMKQYLSGTFRFRTKENDSIIWHKALKGRIEIILKTNPDKKIFHTTQVELNGFIHSIVSGTRLENKGYSYYGKRAYQALISDSMILPILMLNIPARDPDSETGSAFIKRIAPLPLNDREEEIYRAISSGNIPDFLRNTITLTGEFADSAGVLHKVSFETMPDYLAVGCDSDFCRIPMNPYTAQRLASEFGASMITAALSDYIYRKADIKLTPFNYIPVGNANELVTKFEEHNAQIEKQLREAGGVHGQLIAGIKKDVILSGRIADQPGKVVIYGWHKPDGRPIQPVYSGHVWWYVDYSHGIRLINNQVMINGKSYSFADVLQDPVLYKIFSDEKGPMKKTEYIRQ